MPRLSENFTLDATLKAVLNTTAFRAELGNGHEFTAFAGRGAEVQTAGLQPGMKVRVELSPYDMSRGRLIFEEKAET